MKPVIGIVVPFYNTPMWGQTSVYGLKKTLQQPRYLDKFDLRVMVVDNSTEEGVRSFKKNSINAIKGVLDIDGDVSVVKNPSPLPFHGTTLDYAVEAMDVDYLLCWESDINILSDDWFDFIWSHVDNQPDVWMAGYEFRTYEGKTHGIEWYVMPNPGIYRMDILKEIHAEVKSNKSADHFFGEGYSKSANIPISPPEFGRPPEIHFEYGVFSERRGFPEAHPNSPDGKGEMARPHACFYENGQWLFYRMMRDPRGLNSRSMGAHLQVDMVNGSLTPMFADFGNGMFRHYWAGTRSWDFLTHEENNSSQINYVRPKIEKEIELWRQTVPDEIRSIIPDVFNSMRRDDAEIANLRHMVEHGNAPPDCRKLAMEASEWWQKEFLNSNFTNLYP